MNNWINIALVLAASLTVAAAGASPDAQALQGTWLPVTGELGGKPFPDAVLKSITLKLTGGDYEVTVTGAPTPDLGSWNVDTNATPKAMTIVGRQGPNAGKTFPAIYELKADTLKICYDLAGQQRPAAFATTAGTKLFLVTYQRKQP